jgi:adenylate cyclase
LENYSLLLAAINLTYSRNTEEFKRADALFDILIDRLPSNGAINTWRAYWYQLRFHQGWSPDPQKDGEMAQRFCDRAIEIEPESSLALATRGLVLTVMERQLDAGLHDLNEAIRINPNDPIAWLYRGCNLMFSDAGAAAALSVDRAMHLAPFDPAKFIYESVAASAAFVKGDFARAESLTASSLKANRLHASTWRVRVAALCKLGRIEEARTAARDLLDIDPELRVNTWLERSPSGRNRVGREFAACLLASGIPK